jgi:hypothetical protein
MRSTIPLLIVATLLSVGELRAQESSPTDYESQLRAMVAEPAAHAPDREVLREFLDRAHVADVVAEYGLDLERLRAGVNTLGADAVSDLSRHVRDMGEAADLVGGSTVVISTTTIIIVLLLLILLT